MTKQEIQRSEKILNELLLATKDKTLRIKIYELWNLIIGDDEDN